MNKLPIEKRRQILHLMVEGNSVRGIARLVDASPVTVLRYLALAGTACAEFHDEAVRNVKSRRVQCDEIWSFNYCKKVNLPKAKAAPEMAGDIWTWTALDSDSKLILSYFVGARDRESARFFLTDHTERVADRIQLTTDGLQLYRNAVDVTFGNHVDFAQLVKIYSQTPDVAGPERKYSPGVCVGARKVAVYGMPDGDHVSTSHAQSIHAPARAALHSPNCRSLQEVREPCSHGCALHRLVQLCTDQFRREDGSGDGGWNFRPPMGNGRSGPGGG